MRVIVFFSLIIVFLACSPKLNIPYERNAAVEFVQGDKNTITLNAHGYGADAGIASWYAERNALENILFRGIPGSNQENPMIENESHALRDNKQALDYLILNGGYQKFLIESYTENVRKSSQGTTIRQIVKFDLQALRKHLENEKVVRKFGL